MKSRLDLIEGTIKKIFENDSSILPWMDEQSTLIHKLLELIQENLVNLEDDPNNLPSQFVIYLNSEDRRRLDRKDNWIEPVENFIMENAAELGFTFEKKPEIDVVTRNSLSRGEVKIKMTTSHPDNGQTNVVPVILKSVPEKKEHSPCKAFLILEDESLFPLDKCVTNIGRKSSNHLVINDLRISRTHAQIRTVSDGYIIFDIGSSGGTYINGERINQHKLKPGDVISLAGIKLIYSEDQANSPEENKQRTSELKIYNPTGDSPC
jgi:hypothetical protein